MASSHPRWTNCYQVYLLSQVALGYVGISILQQGKAPGGPGGFPAGLVRWRGGWHGKKTTVCVCSVLQLSKFWQPATQELLNQSLCQQLHFPFHEFTWLPLNPPNFWPGSYSVGCAVAICIFCRFWALYTTLSKTFREHLDLLAFCKISTMCICKIKSRTNLVEGISLKAQ